MPEYDLVVVLTSAHSEVQHAQGVLDAIWECLLPGMDQPGTTQEDEALAQRLGALALPLPMGSAGPDHSVTGVLDATVEDSALPHGTSVTVEPAEHGWRVRFDSPLDTGIAVGLGRWSESRPLGRAVCAAGAWTESVFVADLYVITGPHRVRLEMDAQRGTATLRWITVPLTTSDLVLHLQHPLMTRPDVA